MSADSGRLSYIGGSAGVVGVNSIVKMIHWGIIATKL